MTGQPTDPFGGDESVAPVDVAAARQLADRVEAAAREMFEQQWGGWDTSLRGPVGEEARKNWRRAAEKVLTAAGLSALCDELVRARAALNQSGVELQQMMDDRDSWAQDCHAEQQRLARIRALLMGAEYMTPNHDCDAIEAVPVADLLAVLGGDE